MRTRRVLLVVLHLCGGALAAPVGAAASEADRWVGVYDMVGDLRFKDDAPDPAKPRDPLLAELERRDDLEGLDAVVTAHLQPWAVQRMKDSDASADDLGAICQFTGMFRYPTSAGGLMWLATPTKILMTWAYLDGVGVRRVYLNATHPRNLAPSWNGHSIGHWEGKTLVVDTIGFNDKSWLHTSMQPHTEELHVIERITAIGDGSILEIHTAVDDRKSLKAPYSYTRHFKKTAAEFSQIESQCNSEPGDQQMWNYMRNGALEKYRPRMRDLLKAGPQKVDAKKPEATKRAP